MTMMRTHHCGQLSLSQVGDTVTLNGWVDKVRNLGGFLFLDLRDRFGLTQCVSEGESESLSNRTLQELKAESCVQIRGCVRARPQGMKNLEIATGAIEVLIQEVTVWSKADPLPFQFGQESSEQLRLKHRYLDLRDPSLRQRIVARSQLTSSLRKLLEEHDFLDLETPYLYKSTPEGAREYLIPARVSPGQFYALPQSPQLFKQMYMVGGMDRYYQLVKAFRDEDLRADRQPEFTQVDCELSFVNEVAVRQIFTDVVRRLVNGFLGRECVTDIPQMSFEEALHAYGNDKPDTRFEMLLQDCSELWRDSSFQAFSAVVAAGGVVNAIVVEGQAAHMSRKDLDALNQEALNLGAKGLAWAKCNGTELQDLQSPLKKFVDEPLWSQLQVQLGVKSGDLLLFCAGPFDLVKAVLGKIRLSLGERLGYMDPQQLKFLWVVDFPLLEQDEETGRWAARHHPFCMPQAQDLPLLRTQPEKVRACAYDLVCNGYEVAGGSIRNHDLAVQKQVFAAIGLSEEEAESKFGFLLEALRYGPPPHGGIAFGWDRFVMLMTACDAIRDVIAFPKTLSGQCLMTQSPAPVTQQELDTLGVVHRVTS
ncbi:MAG: aspartate--tRNA ligase [Zetaproteobacteria bacterium]|nr:aspartate--tRNA ligase [Zetaproteobacteria bacterium]